MSISILDPGQDQGRIRVETERQKHRSRAFRAMKFSIQVISSTVFDFEFYFRSERFRAEKWSIILSIRKFQASISLEKNFE